MDREVFKQAALKNLTGLCVDFLSNKRKAEEELKAMESEIPNEEEKEQEKRLADERMKKYNERLDELAEVRRRLE
jgi:hypothetical protein